MSYGANFANADPANAPLNPTIFIGAAPSFWAAILLALAAALLIGWYFGQRARRSGADAAHAIWKAIQDAVGSAMEADDNALKGRAEALRKVIEDRLGKTLKLSGGLSGWIKKLDDAIAGRSRNCRASRPRAIPSRWPTRAGAATSRPRWWWSPATCPRAYRAKRP